jgi:hypothetical protein
MTAGKQLWRNRKEKKEWARRLQSEDPGLEVVHPHAAGIDVGNSTHYVAVRPDRDPEPQARFSSPDEEFHSAAAGSFARNSFAVVTSGRSGSAFFQSVRNC